MFETSRDILNIILAASIGAVAFFFCWMMYYLAMSLKNVFKMFKDVREILGEVRDTVRAFRGKVTEAAAFFAMMSEGMKKVIDYVKDKKGSKEEK